MNEAKSRYCDAQKIHIFDDFLLKSQYYDVQKYWKKLVFKRSRRWNQNTIMPKKYRYFMIFVKITLLWCQRIKKMYLRRRQAKITTLSCQKNKIILWFFAKITTLWCPKLLKFLHMIPAHILPNENLHLFFPEKSG